MLAFSREQNARFLTTMAIINAIIHVGNGIISAVSGGSASSRSGHSLKKTLSSLRELLLQENSFATEAKTAKIAELLQSEVAKGPIKFKAQASTTRSKKRGLSKKRS